MKKELNQLFTGPVINYNLTTDELVNQTLKLEQGSLTDTGALVVKTGEFTGRSPKDRFIVKDSITADSVDWGNFNRPIEEQYFLALKAELLEYLNKQKVLWVRDVRACASDAFRLNILVVNENPWSNLFVKNMFLQPSAIDHEGFEAEWLVLQAPGFFAQRERHHTRQHNFSIISFKHKTILIGGTGYTGEMKKGIFSVLNFLLPYNHKVLSMHCSANVGKDGDTAIFFGLSGTGKTTLSTDPKRSLVGDDEHGWADDGVFNFEGGCYAKLIDLSSQNEPDIFNAIKPGALVENSCYLPGTNRLNFADRSITENTRVSYPLSFIQNTRIPSVAGIPKNIFFLTCDAYGVLPPISKLTPGQAMYYFISGYTARVAGTEEGVKEPQATFSACFGAPFITLHPGFYAKILGDKIESNQVKVWMVNTGWTGGPYGVGARIKLSATRAIINAVLDGSLNTVTYDIHPVLGLSMPTQCPGVISTLLNPRNTWANPAAYDETVKQMADKFKTNFLKYEAGVTDNIMNAGPVRLEKVNV
jgi:phosphoenolpyruvate carboxykinase (ATP)